MSLLVGASGAFSLFRFKDRYGNTVFQLHGISDGQVLSAPQLRELLLLLQREARLRLESGAS